MTPHLSAGAMTAIATLAIDQASKLWLLYVFDIAHRGAVRVTPFFDLVLAWNVGISFGWFQTDSQIAQIGLMAVKAIAVIVLGVWMARSRTLLATLALGLIIGGAVGNGIDRFLHGAVVDFALFHLQIGGNTFNWYVFNLADVAIVAGVAALLYDSFLGVPAAKAP
ncbi:signal peptidase II [Bradyrhizobium sp. KBS0727]|uniref:signal peptidase II n=1 Tax=unclassified Bradyrhizobium TaxID=2631580 RepID=UPI00110F3956|nr:MULTISPECIES: signal peptidase II [unclassified Bradyrhizobium]QDW36716.1 signal peptidase II [Bradyrhizobium sp. KBS0725]QDW43317.1 signal peptidase II [Bradyrhizobium sp. KBS0727]